MPQPMPQRQIDPPVSVICCVQCSRNGAALAHVLNWIGESSPSLAPGWLRAFDDTLDENGLRVLCALARSGREQADG
jgi:hypothetical protein